MQLKNVVFAITLIASLATTGVAEQQPKQEPAAKPRATKPAQKAAEADEKIEVEPAQPSQEELMRRSLDDLSAQINQLTSELQKLRRDNEHNSDVMQLLLSEERLAKVEEKAQEAIDYKMQLDAREADIQRRSRNIQQEVTMRGGLRRDEAEVAIRAEFGRALEDIHTQQSNYQQRIAELQAQAARLRTRVETLRKKIERTEEKEQ
jgi:chromosome segregation ATPase